MSLRIFSLTGKAKAKTSSGIPSSFFLKSHSSRHIFKSDLILTNSTEVCNVKS